MRAAVAIAFMLSLVPLSASADQASPGAAPVSEILAADSTWARAILSQDPAVLRQVMSPEYRLTFASNDKSIDLKTWMQNFMKMKMHAYSPRVTHLRLLGPDAVAATVSSNWEATLANGKRLSETFTSIDTWQRIDGRWIAAGRHVVDLKVLERPPGN
ncbi:nuclear transport factor 2 family protein [Lysobacter xanthus]